jgi:hypothetical protein
MILRLATDRRWSGTLVASAEGAPSNGREVSDVVNTRRNCRRSLSMPALPSWGATMKHFAHDFGLRIAAIPELRRTTHHDRVCWPVQRTLTCVRQCVWLR